MAGVAPVTATTSTAPPVSQATYSRIGFRVAGIPAPKGSARAVIDGYHAPVVEQREHDLAGASPFLRVRCRATRLTGGAE